MNDDTAHLTRRSLLAGVASLGADAALPLRAADAGQLRFDVAWPQRNRIRDCPAGRAGSAAPRACHRPTGGACPTPRPYRAVTPAS
ncbi:hypothetical protein [Immundisolibacter sp.]